MRKSSLMMLLAGAFILVLSTVAMAAATYDLNFEDGNVGPLEFFGTPQWKVVDDAAAGGKALFISETNGREGFVKLGTYALLPDTYSDFVFEADARFSEEQDTGSVAVMFSFKDDPNYSYAYYSHREITKFRILTDGNTNDILVVEDHFPDFDKYHHIKVMRKGDQLQAWLDGKLIMEAVDPNPVEGRVGIGTWSHMAYFDNVKVYQP